MAEEVVGTIVGKLSTAAINRLGLLLGVRGDIKHIKDQLNTMKAYLRDAEETQDTDLHARNWVVQVQELAYDAEDCIDEFQFHLSQPTAHGLAVLEDLAKETAKYAFPRRFEARNLEEALMSVPDLETVKFRVLKRTEQYEIREVEPYFIAKTTMPGKTGFDFNGSSQAFNVLASYLFGKNTAGEQMEMTTPVFTRKVQSGGENMDMTTPVITKQSGDQGKWQMSFVMPSKYGANLPLPKDPSIAIKEVPSKIVAVMAFSGFVTDEDVKHRESKLREALRSDTQFQVKEDALVEVAQFNPPFTLPFTRRNEITLEVEDKTK